MMKKIKGFKTKEKVDTLIDRFQEMVTETEAVRLVDKIEYAQSALFVDRLEENGKINSYKKVRLKDMLEDVDGNPKEGDDNTMKLMIK